jgi:hypothetical protein
MELRSKRRGLSEPTITQDEWRKALGDATTIDDQSALTIAEMADLYGAHRQGIARRLATLMKNGLAIRTFKRIKTADGFARRVPAYKLVPAKK